MKQKLLPLTFLGLTLMLMGVWSLPGMTAVRHLLLLMALVIGVYISRGIGAFNVLHQQPWGFRFLFMLSFWFVVQALFVSQETRWALGELRGQWLTALMAMVLGMLTAAIGYTRLSPAGRGKGGVDVTTLIFLVLLGEALITDGVSIAHWFTNGSLLRQEVPLTGGKLEMSYLLNILLAGISADLLFRACNREPLLKIPIRWTLFSLAATLFGLYICNARNGVIGVAFLLGSSISLFIYEKRKVWRVGQLLGAVIAIFLAATTYGILNYKADPRWQSFKESAELGWQAVEDARWTDPSFPTPLLANGQSVEESAYRRVLFIHGGIKEIEEHPWGVGYGRNAFAHALRQKQPDVLAGHAHSGFVDLGIAGGYPALVLWLCFVGAVGLAGARSYFRDGSAHGLVLIFLVTGYTGRMLLDSVNRDHMLQIFFFLVGYFLTRLPAPRLQSIG